MWIMNKRWDIYGLFLYGFLGEKGIFIWDYWSGFLLGFYREIGEIQVGLLGSWVGLGLWGWEMDGLDVVWGKGEWINSF